MSLALKHNLDNLHQYWLALNPVQDGEIYRHTRWPNKRWRPDFSLNNVTFAVGERASTIEECDEERLSALSRANGLELQKLFQLQIMTLELESESTFQRQPDIERVISHAQMQAWTEACGNAFGYALDIAAIVHIHKDPNCHLFVFYKEGEIAGTVLLYQTGKTMGVHQLGTLKAFRQRGVAAALMAHSLAFAKEKACTHVTLQASKAGVPLYEKLGFKQVGKLSGLLAG
ncbi:GNAT family N-acetyltransferase [Enterovibrio coralii]|uniref:N-acetyltransferase domain-containing protein n=1 Tax=Enterovibrio coralii TaxID=294935 RepID=A0A135I5U9_9GAMM|nr:GNAT family N-acetyltransferase [Enterovibrio coralii]KXF80764.1 hypothetical protein ATN88_15890 [Enterovibrio coralii]